MTDSDNSIPGPRGGLTALEKLAIAVVIATFLARLWLALALDLDGDEGYYAFWAAWPSLAYLDHPPGVALSIWLGEAIFGHTVLGVRAFALTAQLLVAAALYRTTRLLVPGRDAAAIAVIWYSLTLIAAVAFVATPDAPSMLFWTLSVWATAEAVVRSRPSWWLAVGVFAGLGLVSKYTNAWLGIGLVLYLFATREGRRQLRTWQVWAGGALALVVFSPVLWWNATHDWRSFLFQGVRVVTFRDEVPGYFLVEYIISQSLLIGPVLAICAALGFLWYALRRGKPGASLALPVLTSLPLLAYFLFHSLHSRVAANWPQPVLPMLAVVAAWAVLSLRSEKLRRGAHLGQVGFGTLMIALVCIQAVFHPVDLGGMDRTAMLRGWKQLAAEVRAAADAHGARSILTNSTYRLSGELFFYGQEAGDPRPVRNLDAPLRYAFIPAEERFPKLFPALFVKQGRTPPTNYFNSVEPVGQLTRGTGQSVEHYTLYLVSDPTDAFPSAD